MSILKKLKEIRHKREKKLEVKEVQVIESPKAENEVIQQKEEEKPTETEFVETEKIYNIPRHSRCNSVFIQLATGVSSEDLTSKEEVEVNNAEIEEENATDTTDESMETIETIEEGSYVFLSFHCRGIGKFE